MHSFIRALAPALALCLTLAPAGAQAALIGTSGIADGAITTPKLATGAVTAVKMANGAVGTAQLAAGAVTDAKITGPISASKIQGGVFQQKYAQVVTVAKAGGDFTDPVAAMAAITTASAATPFLLQIMPGVYDLGAVSLTMKPYVDVEGSGRNATVLRGSVGTSSGYLNAGPGLVNGASHAELRNLTVSNSFTGGPLAVGIHSNWLDDQATGALSTFSVDGVDVYVTGGGAGPSGTSAIGITSNFSTTRVRRSRVQISHGVGQGYGMAVMYGNADVKDVEIAVAADAGSGAFGIFFGGVPALTGPGLNRVDGVRVAVSSPDYRAYGILVGGIGAAAPVLVKDAVVGATAPEAALFDGNAEPGVLRCAATYDAQLNPVACPQ